MPPPALYFLVIQPVSVSLEPFKAGSQFNLIWKERAMRASRLLWVIVAFSNLLAFTQSTFAQGALSPSAAPSPTMKTLAQIEPRIPISALPATISVSGSYYVTTNLTGVAGGINGITILASDVTVDLSGFTLQGVAGSGAGIYVPNAVRNLAIRNGAMDSWGGSGVSAANVYDSQFERLRISNTGGDGLQAGSNCVVFVCSVNGNGGYGMQVGYSCTVIGCNASGNGVGEFSSGINVGNNCTVKDCTASGNDWDGIIAENNSTVKDCTVSGNGGVGIDSGNNCTVNDCTASDDLDTGIDVGNNCTVNNCTASGNNTGVGILSGNNCTVNNSTASENGEDGIAVGGNCTVNDCTAGNNTGDGIDVGNNCTVIACTASGNSGAGVDGIYVYGNNCQIVGNTCNGNSSDGIGIVGVQNHIDGNTVGGNTQYGIYPFSANVTNSITRNVASGNGTNYDNYAGNSDYAPTGSVSTATNPWTNF